MKEFNLRKQINTWIKNKTLIQVHDDEQTENFKVSQILKLENDYLTFSVIAIDGCYSKTSVCHINDVQLFRTDTVYLAEFSKRIDLEKVYQQALTDINGIEKFTIIGVLSAFHGKKSLVSIAYGSGEEFTGRVIYVDKTTLIIDEYGIEFDRYISRTYLKVEEIARVYLGDNNLRTISLSLIDKKL